MGRLVDMFLADMSNNSAHVADEDLTPGQRWLYIMISVALTVTAGLMSGLTIGLMALDDLAMEVLKRSGNAQERRYAAAVGPLLQNHHYLLCTLVLWNAAAMEALPLFLDRLADPITAVVMSVTVVLLFGEIVPQSICTRYGLAVGYYTSWILRFCMLVATPVAWPLGRLLDRILGHSGSALPRNQLQQYVALHSEAEGYAGSGEGLSADELHVINSALELTAKRARAAMTPLNKVYMLDTDRVLDGDTIAEVLSRGHSRVPVHAPGDRTAITGLLIIKELLSAVPEQKRIRDCKTRSMQRLSAGMPLWDVLHIFKTGRAHMALVCEATKEEQERAKRELVDGAMNSDRIDGATQGRPTADPVSDAAAEMRRLLPSGDGGTAQQDFTEVVRTAVSVQDLARNFADMTYGAPVGIITLEDVLEELIGGEILDETDRYVDNLQTRMVGRRDLDRGAPQHLFYLDKLGMFTPRIHHGHAGSVGGRQSSFMLGAAPRRRAADGAGPSATQEHVPPGRAASAAGAASFLSTADTVVSEMAAERGESPGASLLGGHASPTPSAALTGRDGGVTPDEYRRAVEKVESIFQAPDVADAVSVIKEATNFSQQATGRVMAARQARGRVYDKRIAQLMSEEGGGAQR